MSTKSREVIEGTQYLGVKESIAWPVEIPTEWGTVFAVVSTTARDITENQWTDVSATLLTGASTVVANVWTTPLIHSGTLHHKYWVDTVITSGGNTFNPFLIVEFDH